VTAHLAGANVIAVRFAPLGTNMPRSLDADLDRAFRPHLHTLADEPVTLPAEPPRWGQPQRTLAFAAVIDLANPRVRIAIPEVLLRRSADGSWAHFYTDPSEQERRGPQ
jgi:hypothetical protein